MINGVHAIIYTKSAAKARAFFKETLGYRSVDAGGGWLIFALPPAEVAAHPLYGGEENGKHELYLMCDDIHKTVADLKKKGIEFASEPKDRGWGILAMMTIPGGGDIGLYQPKHPIAVKLKGTRRKSATRKPAKRKR